MSENNFDTFWNFIIQKREECNSDR